MPLSTRQNPEVQASHVPATRSKDWNVIHAFWDAYWTGRLLTFLKQCGALLLPIMNGPSLHQPIHVHSEQTQTCTLLILSPWHLIMPFRVNIQFDSLGQHSATSNSSSFITFNSARSDHVPVRRSALAGVQCSAAFNMYIKCGGEQEFDTSVRLSILSYKIFKGIICVFDICRFCTFEQNEIYNLHLQESDLNNATTINPLFDILSVVFHR